MHYCKSSIPCVGLYKDSECAKVTLNIESSLQIVSYLLDCIFTCLTYYSTESLCKFLIALSLSSLMGAEKVAQLCYDHLPFFSPYASSSYLS